MAGLPCSAPSRPKEHVVYTVPHLSNTHHRVTVHLPLRPSAGAAITRPPPAQVNQRNMAEWGWNSAAVHPGMTMLPEKLATAGYRSHQVCHQSCFTHFAPRACIASCCINLRHTQILPAPCTAVTILQPIALPRWLSYSPSHYCGACLTAHRIPGSALTTSPSLHPGSPSSPSWASGTLDWRASSTHPLAAASTPVSGAAVVAVVHDTPLHVRRPRPLVHHPGTATLAADRNCGCGNK